MIKHALLLYGAVAHSYMVNAQAGECPQVQTIDSLPSHFLVDDAYFSKWVYAVGGIPILGTDGVADEVLLHSGKTLNYLLQDIPWVGEELADLRFVVSIVENDLDVPKIPVRGLSPSQEPPAVSIGWDSAGCQTLSAGIAVETIRCSGSEGNPLVRVLAESIFMIGLGHANTDYFLATVNEWCYRDPDIYTNTTVSHKDFNSFYSKATEAYFDIATTEVVASTDNPDKFSSEQLLVRNPCLSQSLASIYGTATDSDRQIFSCVGQENPDMANTCDEYWAGVAKSYRKINRKFVVQECNGELAFTSCPAVNGKGVQVSCKAGNVPLECVDDELWRDPEGFGCSSYRGDCDFCTLYADFEPEKYCKASCTSCGAAVAAAHRPKCTKSFPTLISSRLGEPDHTLLIVTAGVISVVGSVTGYAVFRKFSHSASGEEYAIQLQTADEAKLNLVQLPSNVVIDKQTDSETAIPLNSSFFKKHKFKAVGQELNVRLADEGNNTPTAAVLEPPPREKKSKKNGKSFHLLNLRANPEARERAGTSVSKNAFLGRLNSDTRAGLMKFFAGKSGVFGMGSSNSNMYGVGGAPKPKHSSGSSGSKRSPFSSASESTSASQSTSSGAPTPPPRPAKKPGAHHKRRRRRKVPVKSQSPEI